jgi:hypothetical protein
MNYLKMRLVGIASAVAGLLTFAGLAHGATDSFSFITLPETALADVSQYVPQAFTSLWVVIALVIGLPIAFYVIRKVIGLFGHVK